MSSSSLAKRVDQLEAAKDKPDQWRGVREFRFALWTDRLPEDTPMAPGSRIIEDFHMMHEVENWSGRGILFRGGFRQQRVASDPTDTGDMKNATY